MKLKFKNQDFQTDAVNAVADLFQGHQKMRSTFEIVQEAQLSLWQNDLGIGNGISISDERLNENMHEVQRRNNLPIFIPLYESRQKNQGLLSGSSEDFGRLQHKYIASAKGYRFFGGKRLHHKRDAIP